MTAREERATRSAVAVRRAAEVVPHTRATWRAGTTMLQGPTDALSACGGRTLGRSERWRPRQVQRVLERAPS